MLESYTLQTFVPLVGGTFVMHLDPSNSIELELVESVALAGPGTSAASSPRQAFSLIFRGPRTPVVVQRIYQLENATLGAFDLFLVPIGPDERGLLYEAVFN